ncbi:MAG: hypothetical protein FI729_05785 [SAR202 cluster bacterium]|nr:hypothetical protein [SAR202 cluster bacterium]|tara:strand:+ start:11722 stop:12339 length:618 start_codon:yes stop_codon:yes gene_type:complete
MPIIIDSFWKERIKMIKANNETYGAVKILDALRSMERAAGYEYDGPSEATIGRVLKNEWSKMETEEKNSYREVLWPESMEAGYLPWYMSRSALELLKLNDSQSIDENHFREDKKYERGLLLRPSVNDVKWFWLVSESLPEHLIPLQYEESNVKARWLVAKFLQMRDFGSLDSQSSSTYEITRFLERAMINGMDRESVSALEQFLY